MTNLNHLLNQRDETHGNFTDNARISQQLKNIFTAELSKQLALHDSKHVWVIYEVLDQLAMKLSRILSGKAEKIEHWEDIAGYAKLVMEELQKDIKPVPQGASLEPQEGEYFVQTADKKQ